MTNIDKIREKFEFDQKNQPTDLEKDNEGYYLDTFTIGLFRIYERAYQQGQRDLIEAMEAVTYDTNGRPLYRLPEDMKK